MHFFRPVRTEKKAPDVTATMATVVPTQAKRPASGPQKPRVPAATPITNMVVSKPIRHLAILPSAKDPPSQSRSHAPANLSGNSIRTADPCSLDPGL